MRATLVALGEQDHVLVMMMHHIIGDVWSVRVVMKELATLYEAFLRARPSPLPQLQSRLLQLYLAARMAPGRRLAIATRLLETEAERDA